MLTVEKFLEGKEKKGRMCILVYTLARGYEILMRFHSLQFPVKYAHYVDPCYKL